MGTHLTALFMLPLTPALTTFTSYQVWVFSINPLRTCTRASLAVVSPKASHNDMFDHPNAHAAAPTIHTTTTYDVTLLCSSSPDNLPTEKSLNAENISPRRYVNAGMRTPEAMEVNSYNKGSMPRCTLNIHCKRASSICTTDNVGSSTCIKQCW